MNNKKDEELEKIAKELLKNKSTDDFKLTGENGILTPLLSKIFDIALDEEMNLHLGYENNQRKNKKVSNSRNGKTHKNLKSELGNILVTTPRDRDGTFEPEIIKKNQRSLTGFQEQVLSLYANGMTTNDITEHLQSIYGQSISTTLVSKITNRIYEESLEWRSRALKDKYACIIIDAVVLRVNNLDSSKMPVYIPYAIDMDGYREVLGLYTNGTNGESSSTWQKILQDLTLRGVKDVYIICADGLTGIEKSVKNVFPNAIFQTCVVHMIRNTLKNIPYQNRREIATDLKNVYKATNEEIALNKLNEIKEKWKDKYPNLLNSWYKKWDLFVPFLQFSNGIRKMI